MKSHSSLLHLNSRRLLCKSTQTKLETLSDGPHPAMLVEPKGTWVTELNLRFTGREDWLEHQRSVENGHSSFWLSSGSPEGLFLEALSLSNCGEAAFCVAARARWCLLAQHHGQPSWAAGTYLLMTVPIPPWVGEKSSSLCSCQRSRALVALHGKEFIVGVWKSPCR